MPSKRLLRSSITALLCVLITHLSFSQTKTVTGKVNDDKGAPVAGATVSAKGTKTGTSTDGTGTFRLTVPESIKQLTISFVGFVSQDVDISGTTTVDVALVATNAA